MISKETIDQVKAQIDIVDVISDFVTLKRVGQNYKALSPFTNEKTSSFYVVPSKNIFKDFSSGKGGNAITFIMEHEGMGYIEAIRYLAKKYGIDLKEEAYRKDSDNIRDSLYLAMAYAKDFFRQALTGSEEGNAFAQSYLQERQIEEAFQKKFELGYSFDDWNALEKSAIAKGFSQEILLQAGLLVKNDNDKIFDRFRNRIMFPVHNLSGKIVAFGARVMGKADNQPKYLNSPETEIYHKSDVLYGLYFAKNSIRRENECILVEGYTDVISLHQARIENVVSSSGTALTKQQIQLIQRFTENITVVYDADRAGIDASIRGIDMILSEGMKVRVVTLPEGEDPDSFSRKHGSRVQEYIKNNKQDFVSYKASLLLKEAAGDPIKKAGAIKEIITSLSCVTDPIERSVLAKEVASIMQIEEMLVITELNKRSIKARTIERDSVRVVEQAKDILQETAPKADVNSLVEMQEREIVRSLFNYGEQILPDGRRLADLIIDELSDIDFVTPLYTTIFEIYKRSVFEGHVPNLDFFLTHENESLRKLATNLSIDQHDLSSNWKEIHHIEISHEKDDVQKLAIDNVLRLKFRVVQKMIKDNIIAMRSAANEEDVYRFLEVHTQMKDMEKLLADELGIVIAGA